MFNDVQTLVNHSIAWSMMPLEQWALWTDSSRKTLDTWVTKTLEEQDEWLKQVSVVADTQTSLVAVAPQSAPAVVAEVSAPVVEPAAEAAAVEVEVEAPAVVEAPMVETAAAEDDLTRISGVGPALAKKLAGAGYTTFAQIASLSDDEIAELEATVIRFSGRIQRDDWKGQARVFLDQA